MRFRAKMVDFNCVQYFSRVLGTLSKLAKSCVCRITPDKVYFIVPETGSTAGGAGIWCEISQENFFDEFAMDGLSVEDNEIYLEVTPDLLARAMKSAQPMSTVAARCVKIKLTNKEKPCLTFDIEMPTLAGHSRHVIHDVPVSVVARRYWPDYSEPAMPDFQVSLYMPSLKMLKNIADRMKNLSNHLVISASKAGCMQIRVETDDVVVRTHFKNLTAPTWSTAVTNTENGESQEELMYEARVDIKRFIQFLSGQQINPTKVICNIVDGKMIHLFLLHQDVSLQYFLPATAT